MLILTASDVAAVFRMPQAFDAVRAAAIAHVEARTEVPTRVALSVPATSGEFLVMPGVVHERTFGTKVWFTFPEGHGDIPATAAMLLLVDPDSGQEVLMDGSVITDLRTGAMTGLAAEALAPAGATTLALIGTGIQARTQALALVHALPGLDTIRVTSRDATRRERFAAELGAEIRQLHPGRSLRVVAVHGGETAVHGAAVVVAATTSSSPVIDDDWLDSEVLVCGVGSHEAQSAEIAPQTIARASVVVVDTRGGGVDGAGDLSGPVADGTLVRDSVLELGDILRDPPAEAAGVRVFKSVGFAAADVVSAWAVMAAARDAGLGHEVDLHR